MTLQEEPSGSSEKIIRSRLIKRRIASWYIKREETTH
jgi:hypothetical protein